MNTVLKNLQSFHWLLSYSLRVSSLPVRGDHRDTDADDLVAKSLNVTWGVRGSFVNNTRTPKNVNRIPNVITVLKITIEITVTLVRPNKYMCEGILLLLLLQQYIIIYYFQEIPLYVLYCFECSSAQ